jgi:hypothetical protein
MDAGGWWPEVEKKLRVSAHPALETTRWQQSVSCHLALPSTEKDF